jgi:hypothetical protein
VHKITCALRQILCSLFVMRAHVQAIASCAQAFVPWHDKVPLADEEILAEEEVHQ